MRARTPRRPDARSGPYSWRPAWSALAVLALLASPDAAATEPPAPSPASAAPARTNRQPPPIRPQRPAPPGVSSNGPGDASIVLRPSPAAWDIGQAAQCTAAIHDAEVRHDLPQGLLGAIAKTESGRPVTALGDVRAWPWTIDADGQGLFFQSKAAAVAWAQQGLARGVRFMDIGCMQVNLQMHPEAFRSIEDAFDPASNAEYAAHYLRQLQAEAGGNWNVAVGLYHSHTPDLAAAYRERVAQVGAGIVTGIGGPEPLYMRAIRQGTLRLALAGGGMLVINLNRQPHPTRRHGQSPCQVALVLRPLLASPPQLKGCRV